MNSNKFSTGLVLWKAKNKDPQSYAKVYDLFIDPIYRFILFKVSEPELAKDFAAETFLKVWEYINSGKEIDNLQAMLYKVARNMIIDHYRRKSTQDISLESDVMDRDTDESDIKSNLRLADYIDAKLEVEKLLDAIAKLKDEYREVLLLRYVEGFDIQEIANITEKSNSATRVTIHRALKTLQEVL